MRREEEEGSIEKTRCKVLESFSGMVKE